MIYLFPIQGSGFKNREEKDKYFGPGESRLFQIRGLDSMSTRAIQVPVKAASLNSTDVFVLETPSSLYLWSGNSSSGDEREYAKSVAQRISSKEQTVIPEGKEPADFWKALGGKAAYSNIKEPEIGSHIARLFQCSNARGYFYVEEIFDYDQEVGTHLCYY